MPLACRPASGPVSPLFICCCAADVDKGGWWYRAGRPDGFGLPPRKRPGELPISPLLC